MAEDYQLGKDIARLEDELQRMQALLQDLYRVVEYNLKKENLDEPKEAKK